MSTDELAKHGRHYSERRFTRKIRRLPRSAGRLVVERAILLYVILTDRDTPLWARVVIIGVLGYFVWPFDAIADAIPALGYVDDAIAMGLVLSQVGRFVTPAMRERVLRLIPERLKH